MELNYPLLRAPFEQANKAFRLFHKQLTRELAQIAARVEALDEAQHPAHRMDADATIAALAEIADAISALRQDAKSKAGTQESCLDTCAKRAGYVNELGQMLLDQQPGAKHKATLAAQHDAAVNDRLIADFLLSRGMFESAKIIQDTKQIGHLVDDALYKECNTLVLDLKAHNTATAINWCAQNGSRLRRLQSPLEFRLRFQEVIERIRANERLAAIEYARSFLTPLVMQQENEDFKQAALKSMEVAMMTLTIESPATCGIEAYQDLFAVERWHELVELFRKTFLQVYGMHSPPSLAIALHAGLSTLNTRACHRVRDAHLKKKLVRRRSERDGVSDDCDQTNEDEKVESAKKAKLGSSEGASSTPDVRLFDYPATQVRVSSPVPICPACSEVGSQLCRGMPFAHHPHSRLVCRMTQSVIDENNPAMMLPNGRVYSQQGITAMAQRSQDGMIQCVETHELFAATDVQPVYIL